MVGSIRFSSLSHGGESLDEFESNPLALSQIAPEILYPNEFFIDVFLVDLFGEVAYDHIIYSVFSNLFEDENFPYPKNPLSPTEVPVSLFTVSSAFQSIPGTETSMSAVIAISSDYVNVTLYNPSNPIFGT